MITVNSILEYLTQKYPPETACDFDNVGLLVGNADAPVKKAVVCLDCDISAVNYAESIGAELIITHHPVIFDGIKRVLKGDVVYELVSRNISVISMHTNLDTAVGGVTENLCFKIGLNAVKPYTAHDGFLIREAECDGESADVLAERIKSALGGAVRYVGLGRKINRVLVCSGSGGNYLADVIKNGYDALIAADIKHNVFIDALNHGVAVFDAGHYQSENVVVKPLCEQLSSAFSNTEFCAFNNSNIKFV